jgi:hypothetical protein
MSAVFIFNAVETGLSALVIYNSIRQPQEEYYQNNGQQRAQEADQPGKTSPNAV